MTFASLDGYIEDILQAHDMTKCNPATTTGSDSFKRLLDGDDALTTEQHKQYRRAVGKIQWLAPLRPDVCYAAKELARGLAAPTKEHQAKLKQLLKYVKGTIDYMTMIKPMTFLGPQQPFKIECYVDSDWAGCHTTRKSTSGLVLQLFGATLLTASRTQATIALSSGEAELYAIGTGVAEALYVRNFLQETQLSPNIQVTVYTDSTTGKSIATRMGASKRTEHVQLRYLYMQDLAATNVVRIKKVHTLQNPADVCTKYVSAETQQRHHDKLGIPSGSTPSLRAGVRHFIIGHILATTASHDDDYIRTVVQNHNRANNNAMADGPNPDDPNRYPEPDYGPNFDDMPRMHDPFVDNYPPPRDDDADHDTSGVMHYPGIDHQTTRPTTFPTLTSAQRTDMGYGSSNDSEDLRRQQGPGPYYYDPADDYTRRDDTDSEDILPYHHYYTDGNNDHNHGLQVFINDDDDDGMPPITYTVTTVSLPRPTATSSRGDYSPSNNSLPPSPMAAAAAAAADYVALDDDMVPGYDPTKQPANYGPTTLVADYFEHEKDHPGVQWLLTNGNIQTVKTSNGVDNSNNNVLLPAGSETLKKKAKA